jgi:hypothetical protein
MQISEEKAKAAIEMVHGNCPKRPDINSPRMVLTEVLRLSDGTLDGYTCELCGTTVYVRAKA